MTEKQYLLIKCYNEMWGIYDKKQSATDNPILITYSKASVGFIVNQLNNKNERIQELLEKNEQLKDFIRKISTNNEIILANGTIYKINKVIK